MLNNKLERQQPCFKPMVVRMGCNSPSDKLTNTLCSEYKAIRIFKNFPPIL